MNTEDIMNMQYRKLLTKRETIKRVINIDKKIGIKTIDLYNIELLSFLLTSLENVDKEFTNEEDNNLINKHTNCLINQEEEPTTFDIDYVMNFINLGENKRINDNLNKEIANNYAVHVNKSELISPVSIEVLNKSL